MAMLKTSTSGTRVIDKNSWSKIKGQSVDTAAPKDMKEEEEGVKR